MSISSSLPSYADLNSALTKAEAPFSAAGVHGFICGIICATGGQVDNSWEKALLGEKNSRTLREALTHLYETSFHLITEFSFEFSLLLPSDRSDINLRSEALGNFCQGFLTGLKQTKTDIAKNSPPEVKDALKDLQEIAQVSFGDLSANEEDETAYYELVEYVRLAVLMVFHELNITTTSRRNSHDD